MNNNNFNATLTSRMLSSVERIGNKLPDPAMLFVILLFLVWVLSWILSYVSFDLIDPRTESTLEIKNLLSGVALTEFLSVMVNNFSHFHPVGVVLVAMLGIVSHTAVDAGYVLVIPLVGVIFYTAGRHPLAGIAAAFAGVSGGFSANFVPSSLDPMLQGLSQAGAQIIDPSVVLNPLNNYFFTAASSILIIGLGWYLTEKVVEPRLANTEIDGDEDELPKMDPLEANGVRA